MTITLEWAHRWADPERKLRSRRGTYYFLVRPDRDDHRHVRSSFVMALGAAPTLSRPVEPLL